MDVFLHYMLFSSSKPTKKELREKVSYQLRRNGLRAKIQKDYYYQADRTKEVIGVGIKGGNILVLNRKRIQILD